MCHRPGSWGAAQPAPGGTTLSPARGPDLCGTWRAKQCFLDQLVVNHGGFGGSHRPVTTVFLVSMNGARQHESGHRNHGSLLRTGDGPHARFEPKGSWKKKERVMDKKEAVMMFSHDVMMVINRDVAMMIMMFATRASEKKAHATRKQCDEPTKN